MNDNMNSESSASQKERILRWMLGGNSITPVEALNRFGSFRLGARIADLKADGWDIRTDMVRDGRTGKRYARYSLTGKPVQLKIF